MKFLVLIVLTTACRQAVQCGDLEVIVQPLSYKPAPAGRVVIRCDSRVLTTFVGQRVIKR